MLLLKKACISILIISFFQKEIEKKNFFVTQNFQYAHKDGHWRQYTNNMQKKKKPVKKQNVFTMNNKKTIDTIKTVTKVNT